MSWTQSSAPRDPITEQAATMEGVWNVFLWIALAIGAIVVGLLVFVILRYRRRSDELPNARDEHLPIELTYTAIPLAIVAFLFGLTVVSLGDVDARADDPDVTIEVTAFQWQWRFDYPDAGLTVVGGPDEYPELVLPADADVRFELTSTDVVHSFWIPGFRFKRDVFPEETTTFDVHVDDTTGFWASVGTCAEFCGLDHARMRFSVRIVSQDDFDAWAAAGGGAFPAGDPTDGTDRTGS